MKLVKRTRLCTPWEGTQCGSQSLEWVRAGVEEKGRH